MRGRKDGDATTVGEFEEGLSSAAAPVLAAPSYRMDDGELERVIALVQEAAEQALVRSGFLPELQRLALAAAAAPPAETRSTTAVLATATAWRHNGAMPSVQIKNVPEDTHRVLRKRAAAAHQSLQEYLRTMLIEDASRPTVDEVLRRAGQHDGGSVMFEDAVETIRSDRDRR